MFKLKFCDCRKATLEFILEKEEVLQFCLLQDNEPKTPRKTSSHQKLQDQDQPNQNIAKRLVPSQICGICFFQSWCSLHGTTPARDKWGSPV